MYLKSLVLKGFKSFADRSVLTLEPGITAVVGPNGSGKSNISDAVLWVLGERNAKNLRGQVMEDVIFAGSSARKSVGVAEVTLVLDNSDGALPVDFDEVAITRRMYRNGESDYLINNVISRRMDVLDILHDSGLGTGTHSIISQGHLDSILQSKPEDRRDLIEEAAGVLKHKQRKAKSARKLEQMDQHLARAKDVVAEIERQLGPLQRKAKRAVAYQEVSAELSQLELQLAVDDLRALQKAWDAAKLEESSLNEQVAEARSALGKAEGESERLQELMQEESKGASVLAMKQNRAKGSVDRIDSLQMVLSEKRRSAVSISQELEASLQRNQEQRTAAYKDQTEAQNQLLQLTDDLKQARSKEADLTADYNKARRSREDLERVANNHQRERRDQERNAENARRDLARSQETLANANGRLSATIERKSQVASQLETEQAAYTAATSALSAAEAALQTAKSNDDEARAAMVATRSQRDQARNEADAARKNLQALQAEYAGIEEVDRALARSAGAARAWAESESSLARNGAGKLSDGLNVERAYQAIVETLLGDSLSTLIAADAAAASAFRSELTAKGAAGRVNVHVSAASSEANSINSATQSDIASKAAAFGDRLASHFTANVAVENAAYQLLGNVYICDSFAKALEAHAAVPSCVFATLTGEIVWPTGLAVLGTAADANEGVLARSSRKAACKAEITAAQDTYAAAEATSQELAKTAQAAQDKVLETSQQLASARGAESAARSAVTATKQKLDRAEKDRDTIDSQINAIKLQIEEAEAKVAGLRATVEQCESLAEAAKSQAQQAYDAVNPARELENKLSDQTSEARLAVAQLAEREQFARRALDQAQSTIKNLDAADEQSKRQLGGKRIVVDRMQPLLDVLSSIRDAASATTVTVADMLAQQAEAFGKTSEEAAVARSTAKDARGRLDLLTEKTGQNREAKGRLEMQVQHAINVIVVDCNTPLETALDIAQLDNREDVEAETFKLRRRIANMGVINPDAAKEYEELKVRYDYLASQLNDLKQARLALAKIDKVIDARMRDDFAQTFDIVNENFKEIFAVLFPGGTAELQLVDPEDMENTGVEVVAQPRGKKITKMMLMSGGEKSLVALALLFAVYRTRTVPFYILDEVEAALDDSNLRRLTAYLGELRHSTQLIMITHQRRTMEMADVLFGVSMKGDGVTKVVSQRLDKALQYAE